MIEPDEPQALADALETLSRDPNLRAEMGLRGREIVHQKFNAANEINQLLDLLNPEEAASADVPNG